MPCCLFNIVSCWPGCLAGRVCLSVPMTRALEELFDRPIEIYSSEGEDLRPMKIDFDASGVSVTVSTNREERRREGASRGWGGVVWCGGSVLLF